MVPAGYKLRLSEHGLNEPGIHLDFDGLVNNDGTLVCQDLGALSLNVSDSLFSNNQVLATRALEERLDQVISDYTSEIDSLKNRNEELNNLI